jgi:hypothetical protein
MIANLPMYDWPELQAATDRLWALIRDALRADGIAAPDSLGRSNDLWADWQSPDLLLGQTCGLPYRSRLHGKVSLIATPDYGLPGAPAGHYYSELVVAKDASGDWTDFLDKRLAANGTDSQSGWAAPQNHAALVGRRFDSVMVTGAHRESARAVAEGRADIAAIDAVTWRLIKTHQPDVAARLRSAGRTDPTPGLPLITAPCNNAAAIALAVGHAIAALSAPDAATLGLCGLCAIPAANYLAVPTPGLQAQTPA